MRRKLRLCKHDQGQGQLSKRSDRSLFRNIRLPRFYKPPSYHSKVFIVLLYPHELLCTTLERLKMHAGLRSEDHLHKKRSTNYSSIGSMNLSPSLFENHNPNFSTSCWLSEKRSILWSDWDVVINNYLSQNALI